MATLIIIVISRGPFIVISLLSSVFFAIFLTGSAHATRTSFPGVFDLAQILV